MATDDVDLSGPFVGARVPVRTVTTTYTVVDSDYCILADAGGGAFDVTLPTAVGRTGQCFEVKRISASNTVTVKSAGGTLDGTVAGTGIALDANNKGRVFRSDGTNWKIVAGIG